jgi:endo-1,4-beta-xylanase
MVPPARRAALVTLFTVLMVAAIPASASAVIPCDQNQPPIIGGFMNPSQVTDNHHKYIAVQAIILVADDDSGPVIVELVSATSSESDSGLGKGDKPNDIVQVDLYNFQVRAELGRDSTSRTYTFTYRATDGCNVATETSVTVTVLPRR